MEHGFPYQLVTFLEREPAVNEPVYYGENGWFAQLALKRRFRINDITEDELQDKLKEYCNNSTPLTIATSGLVRPDRMPVSVLPVEATAELLAFHNDLIATLGANITSRYPERDGDNYLPHITAEYNGERVIDVNQLSGKSFVAKRVWLLKDIDGNNSIAYAAYDLGR